MKDSGSSPPDGRREVAANDPKRAAIRDKLSQYPNFKDDCTEKFYEKLFEVMPGVEAMFSDLERQKRMFRLMLDLIVRAVTDDVRLDAYMVELGRKHRKAGVLPMHMRIGRGALIQAVEYACPALTETEREYFNAMYSRMVDAMTRKV
jgi:hemoglobin-like flavoprotein